MTDDSRLKAHLIKHGPLTEEQILRADDYALTMKIPLDEETQIYIIDLKEDITPSIYDLNIDEVAGKK